jgi:transposase
MDIVSRYCAGLDVHKKTVVACVRRLEPEGPAHIAIQTFSTMAADLLRLADWLAAEGVTQVAMESTGVYWKPVYHLLEDRFTLLLVNAHHIQKA